MTHVLVAGAGVAAVECVLALRELAAGRASVELLAPAAELVHRPSSVKTPFGGAAAPRIDLAGLALELGVRHHRSSLAAVEPGRHRVFTRDGEYLPYEVLVVATGARSREAVPGAVTFRGPMSAGRVEEVVGRIAANPGLRLAFAAPAGVRWLLPLYELALLGATDLRGRGVRAPRIVVATGEHQPLEVFGPAASEAIRAALDRAGVELVTSAAAKAFDEALVLEDGRRLAADAVVALPELVGPRIAGLPHDDEGFLPVNEYGHVRGCADVYAAGDATAFPLKHGGLATQQADAVAEAIAARIGTVGMPEPFRPVLRGLLLTGEAPLYLRADLGPGGTREYRVLPVPGTVSSDALWWPPGKVAGRYLTPFLATGTATAPLQDREPAGDRDLRGLDLLMMVAEQDAAAGDHDAAVRALDDTEAWLGPLPRHAREQREAWRRLMQSIARRPP